jgi:hypothetical protein
MAYFGARHPSSVGRKEPNNDYHLAKTSNSSPLGRPSALHNHSHGEKNGGRGGSGSPSGHLARPARKSSMNLTFREPLHPQRYADTLSNEERITRMDALLDILEPTDLMDMFWRKTDVGMRYLMKIFPDAEKGRFLVNAVSFP